MLGSQSKNRITKYACLEVKKEESFHASFLPFSFLPFIKIACAFEQRSSISRHFAFASIVTIRENVTLS